MHGTESHWDVDLCVEGEDRPTNSVKACAGLLISRLEDPHALTREHLQVTASRMNDWYDRRVSRMNDQYDRRVHAHDFQLGDEVYVLNLQLYQGRCPKWVRRYSDIATVVKKINQVTYIVQGDWRMKEKIVHVDKLKLKSRPVVDEPVAPQQ